MVDFIIRWLMRYHYEKLEGYFHHVGNCGLCGSVINEVFPKHWPWGICEKCSSADHLKEV